MKAQSFFPALFFSIGLAAASAYAGDIVKPTPAPVVPNNDDQAHVEEPAVIDHVVYLAKLPAPDALVKAAKLKGTPIIRMDQTGDRIVVVYQYAGGRTVTYAYMLLENAGASDAAVIPPSSARYEVTAPPPPPAPTVVYEEAPPAVYYAPRVSYYDPAWDFWTPLAVGFGLGWGFGGHSHGGYYHGGGYYGHGSWGGRGGWHR